MHEVPQTLTQSNPCASRGREWLTVVGSKIRSFLFSFLFSLSDCHPDPCLSILPSLFRLWLRAVTINPLTCTFSLCFFLFFFFPLTFVLLSSLPLFYIFMSFPSFAFRSSTNSFSYTCNRYGDRNRRSCHHVRGSSSPGLGSSDRRAILARDVTSTPTFLSSAQAGLGMSSWKVTPFVVN